MTLRWTTAGESHGLANTVIIEGLPKGLAIDEDQVNANLKRRQSGVGRSGRQNIENDSVMITAGLKQGRTLGSPLCLVVKNRDVRIDTTKPLSVPRPGHADYAGMVRYATQDLHDIAERASARRTTTLVAAGSVAQQLLSELAVEVLGMVSSIAEVRDTQTCLEFSELKKAVFNSDVFCPHTDVSKQMVARIEKAQAEGHTLGGEVKIVATGVPAGWGSVMTDEERLDGRLASALMTLPAVKGVSIGDGYEMASRPGHEVMDELSVAGSVISHESNHAGGLEGGMTNGMPLVISVAMKPISTQKNPLKSVDVVSMQESQASWYRSDVTAVPALSVIAECSVALVLADEAMRTLGGTHINDVVSRHQQWKQRKIGEA